MSIYHTPFHSCACVHALRRVVNQQAGFVSGSSMMVLSCWLELWLADKSRVDKLKLKINFMLHYEKKSCEVLNEKLDQTDFIHKSFSKKCRVTSATTATFLKMLSHQFAFFWSELNEVSFLQC